MIVHESDEFFILNSNKYSVVGALSTSTVIEYAIIKIERHLFKDCFIGDSLIIVSDLDVVKFIKNRVQKEQRRITILELYKCQK